MNDGFTGTHRSKVDRKGRMSIPARLRRVIEAGDPEWGPDKPMTAKVLYGKHLGDSLQVMTVEEFRAKMGRILAMPDQDPNKNKLRQLFMGFSDDLTVDKDGRCIMPLRFREKMGVIEGELAFMGQGDFFQIWKAETFEDTIDEPLDAWLAEQGDDFDPMSLVP